jgi:hypothetical protein
MWVGGQRQGPGRFTPGKETRYPFYMRLGGAPGAGLDGYGKSRLPTPGFDPRIVQSVASRYTERVIVDPMCRTLQNITGKYLQVTPTPPCTGLLYRVIILFDSFQLSLMSGCLLY